MDQGEDVWMWMHNQVYKFNVVPKANLTKQQCSIVKYKGASLHNMNYYKIVFT